MKSMGGGALRYLKGFARPEVLQPKSPVDLDLLDFIKTKVGFRRRFEISCLAGGEAASFLSQEEIGHGPLIFQIHVIKKPGTEINFGLRQFLHHPNLFIGSIFEETAPEEARGDVAVRVEFRTGGELQELSNGRGPRSRRESARRRAGFSFFKAASSVFLSAPARAGIV